MGAAPIKILAVYDEPEVCSAISSCLAAHGLHCRTTSEPGIVEELLASEQFDVLIADIAMPGLNGLELLVHAKRHSPGCKGIVITGKSNRELLAQALMLGAYEYLEKPLNMDDLMAAVSRAARDESDIPELPLRAADALRTRSSAREASLDSTWALIRAIEAKDPFTKEHSEHVTKYALALGVGLDLSADAIEVLHVAALLHDVGKIGVPDRILTKPGPLTDEEFEYIHRHSALGGDILAKITVFGREAEIVRHHHERWDGAGYPDGLTAQESPLASRIIMVADSMDAMLMTRSYKDSYPVEKMLGELRRCAGTQFDPQIVPVAVEWCNANPDTLILSAQPAKTEALT